MADKTFDLTKIGLPEGTHSIQMKLSGGDKRDSALSNTVTYTVEPQGETWLINESPGGSSSISDTDVSFITNGMSYVGIKILPSPVGADVYYDYDGTAPAGNIHAYIATPLPGERAGWTKQAYRTVAFDEPLDPTTPIGQWFSSNAVKQ